MSEQGQTADELIDTIAKCLPEMTTEERKLWIDDPNSLQALLSGLAAKFWTKENGIITLTLPPTDGTSGPQWIARLEGRGYQIGDYAKRIFWSSEFHPTKGVIYRVKVLTEEALIGTPHSITAIEAEGEKLSFSELNAEAACLIRERFTNKEIKAMGLWRIVVMHQTIEDGNFLGLLTANRDSKDIPWLSSLSDNFRGLSCIDGYAFAAPTQG